MVSINSLVYKNHILKRDIVVEETKRDDGRVCYELIKKLKNTKLLLNVFIKFSEDDTKVKIGSKEFIYIGGLNKNKEILKECTRINNKGTYEYTIDNNFVCVESRLNFQEDFTVEYLDKKMLELLDSLDENYRDLIKVIYI
ncbi:MAG: hypothetical protein ACRC7N_05945 [Clostridium sp.]